MTDETRIPMPADSDLDEANLAFLQRVPPYNVWRMIARTGLAPQFSQPLAVMFTPDWFPPRRPRGHPVPHLPGEWIDLRDTPAPGLQRAAG